MALHTDLGTKPTPSSECFPEAFQGLAITRRLQSNGLHPPELITHDQKTLLAQRVFGIAAGYEDLNVNVVNAPPMVVDQLCTVAACGA